MHRLFLILPLAALTHAPTSVPPAQPVDRFGVRQLAPTLPNGREWFAQWEKPRTVGTYDTDPQDPLVENNADVPLHIGGGTASLEPGVSRLYVGTPRGKDGAFTAPLWKNVELTVYARRGRSSRTPSYQAFDLAARSGHGHNDRDPCDGTSYHATSRFDGLVGFKKEIWHTGGYTGLRPDPAPKPWTTVPPGKWVGMKLLCRNVDGDKHVNLRLYLDRDEKNDWQLVTEYTDRGGWKGDREGCGRPLDAILREGRPVVYFRTDYAAVDLKQFSVREVAPLP